MDMADAKLRTRFEAETSFTYVETTGEGQLHEQEKYTDIEHEIECPRCYDIMVLLSDFDSLYYSCEECGFILYTMKRAS